MSTQQRLATALPVNQPTTSLERMSSLVSVPNAEDYFEAPLAEIESFDRKVNKSQGAAHRRNLANKYPRTELDRMNEQLEKYGFKKKAAEPPK